MLVKAYWYAWLAICAIAVVLFVTDGLTELGLMIFGFIAFGMVFGGMINVLPATIAHPTPKIAAGKPKISVTPLAAPPMVRRAPTMHV